MANWWQPYIRKRSAAMGLDPAAVLAVASAEGLSGAVGDGGHAFGPFQLNDAGGVLTGRAGNHRAFAESRQGIDWALSLIANVAKGQKGNAAINSIVRRFERPAAPDAEVSRASAMYQKFAKGQAAQMAPESGKPVPMDPGAQSSPVFGGKRAAMQSDGRRELLQSLMAQNAAFAQGQQVDPMNTLAALVAAQQAQAQAAPAMQGPPVKELPFKKGKPLPVAPLPNAPKGKRPPIEELFYDPLGGIKRGQEIGAIGHHDDHVHIAMKQAQLMLQAIQHAQQMGLTVRENPYVDPVDPVHVPHSNHYVNFAGKYNGKKLGMAADISGSPKLMAAYYKWAKGHL